MNFMERKVEQLVVDTNTFIKNSALQEVAVNIYTIQDVLDEITSKRQLRNLVVLPYNVVVKDVFTENIKFVTEFSKKTGDYISLSAADIKVIALTYQLEKEMAGCDHLKKEPQFSCVISAVTKPPVDCTKIPGFYVPKRMDNKPSDLFEDGAVPTSSDDYESKERQADEEDNSDCTKEQCKRDISAMPQNVVHDKVMENSSVNSEKLQICGKTHTDDNDKCHSCIVTENSEYMQVTGEMDNCAISSDEHSNKFTEDFDCWRDCDTDEDYDTDDEADWITPENIEDIKKYNGADDVQTKPVSVACVTSDFAMQNVLKQIGLNVISVDGRLIRETRTYVLRCYSCFKRTSIMTKVFCPHCGNRTLKKVAVTLREDGTQEIHINTRRPLSGKGKRFSIPRIRGGKHSNDPILCEDQRIPHQKPSRLSCKKNNPLDPDYIAGFSPFVMRDITSKAAMLGIRNGNLKNCFRRSEVNKPKRKK